MHARKPKMEKKGFFLAFTIGKKGILVDLRACKEPLPMAQFRLERWSIFCGDGMVMVIFSQRWMVFENFSPSPSMVFGRINHRQRWFFDGFPIFTYTDI